MTYAQYGLIEASDYNNFNGGSAGANVSGQLNTVWGVGYGNAGYGQTTGANVVVGSTVQASNWATLINNLNSTRKHQSGGSYSNIGTPVTGDTIAFINTLGSTLTSAYTNRLNLFAYGTSSQTLKTMTLIAPPGSARSQGITFTISFAGIDQARYFFNAGGAITLSYYSFNNIGGTARGTSIYDLAANNFSSKTIYSNSFSARQGAGGVLSFDNTTGGEVGYYGITTTETAKTQIISGGYYSGDYIQYKAWTAGGAGSYGGNGATIYLEFFVYSDSIGSTQPSDSCNIDLTMACTVYPPSVAYINNTWGSVNVTSSSGPYG